VHKRDEPIKRISYSGVVADLFHYGHLHSIRFAQSLSDYNICGILTDEAVEEYRIKPLANLEERKAILESLNCIDRVMVQYTRDPTENLKKIHQEFPEAEIIFVHGDDLKDVPGKDYLEKIGGRVVQHHYYSKLSTFKIINHLLENREKFKDIKAFSSLIKKKNSGKKENLANKTIISSKADTLKALQPILTKSYIEPMYVFTFSDWKNLKAEVIDNIQKEFENTRIVIRSSSTTEDTLESSMAGCFESVLNVDSSDRKEVERAVEKVINSFSRKEAVSSFNQILIQKQTESIVMSGVVFTRTLVKNSPYYVVNYDDQTGSSDSVTSGKENKVITISHFSEPPKKFRPIIEAVREIEDLIPEIPLDLEFALTQENKIVIFQTRPLAANLNKKNRDKEVQLKIAKLKNKFNGFNKPAEHLAGERTIFADMPDWNPAEIIGDNPNYLDYSLYDYLITNSAWHEARTSQGYYDVNPAKLVELFGNKPYVNVRNTFNSFTPAEISFSLRKKLVEFYLQKLKLNPHLHDKVEFEILFTCFDLDLEEREKELIKEGFTVKEIEELNIALLGLTNYLVLNSSKSIPDDLLAVKSMGRQREIIKEKNKTDRLVQELIHDAKTLLDECQEKGTVQFSRLARLGFIGKIILKSLVKKKVIGSLIYDQIFNSINTVASEISQDFQRLITGEMGKDEFFRLYSHLRPGTYDLTSLRYDKNPNLLKSMKIELKREMKADYRWNNSLAESITEEFKTAGLLFDSEHFLKFLKSATEARELSKFEFTKNLSDALELIAEAGEKMGFSRKEISRLDINDILESSSQTSVHEITSRWKRLIQLKEEEMEINDYLSLPSIIFSEQDLDIIEHYDARPNFITQKSVESKIIELKEINKDIPDIEGNIIVLENGDPGYDWIFTRNPAGLITKYGGVASHMSIRCAEFGIPAAIGCGENIYNKLKNAERALIDCKAKKIEVR